MIRAEWNFYKDCCRAAEKYEGRPYKPTLIGFVRMIVRYTNFKSLVCDYVFRGHFWQTHESDDDFVVSCSRCGEVKEAIIALD